MESYENESNKLTLKITTCANVKLFGELVVIELGRFGCDHDLAGSHVLQLHDRAAPGWRILEQSKPSTGRGRPDAGCFAVARISANHPPVANARGGRSRAANFYLLLHQLCCSL